LRREAGEVIPYLFDGDLYIVDTCLAEKQEVDRRAMQDAVIQFIIET
jgi:hypothetical protein